MRFWMRYLRVEDTLVRAPSMHWHWSKCTSWAVWRRVLRALHRFFVTFYIIKFACEINCTKCAQTIFCETNLPTFVFWEFAICKQFNVISSANAKRRQRGMDALKWGKPCWRSWWAMLRRTRQLGRSQLYCPLRRTSKAYLFKVFIYDFSQLALWYI